MSNSRAARRRAHHAPKRLRPIPDMSASYEQPGMVNAYTCPAGHAVFTIIRDPGATPAFMPCHHTEERGNPPVTVECGLRASSAWYRNIPADATPTYEWYRPDDGERRKLDQFGAEHVTAGGLLLRPITAPAAVVADTYPGRSAG